VTSLSSLLTALRYSEAARLARQQEPILRKYAGLTADDPKLFEFHAYYSAWAPEMGHLATA
jgi:hypothetical protein